MKGKFQNISKSITGFLLVFIIGTTLVPFHVFHSHIHEHEHRESVQFPDSGLKDCLSGYSIDKNYTGHQCEHKAHIQEDSFSCEFCEFQITKREKYELLRFSLPFNLTATRLHFFRDTFLSFSGITGENFNKGPPFEVLV